MAVDHQHALKVGDGAIELLVLFFVGIIPGFDCFHERFNDAMQPNRVSDVEALDGVGCSAGGMGSVWGSGMGMEMEAGVSRGCNRSGSGDTDHDNGM